MSCRRWYPILFTLALEASLHCATVRINFVDSFGRPVPFTVEKFQACCQTTSPDFSRNFNGTVAHGIPQTEFTYRLKPVNARDFAITEGKAQVWGEKAFLTIEARPNHAGRVVDFSGAVISGVVTDVQVGDQIPMWVTLLSPYSSREVRDAEVDRTGHFLLVDIKEPGNYVLLVCRGSDILASQSIRITVVGHSELTIKISK